jgi:hypothetical protein
MGGNHLEQRKTDAAPHRCVTASSKNRHTNSAPHRIPRIRAAPDGQISRSADFLSSPFAKNILLHGRAKSPACSQPSRPT